MSDAEAKGGAQQEAANRVRDQVNKQKLVDECYDFWFINVRPKSQPVFGRAGIAIKTNKKPAAFRPNTIGASTLARRIPAKAGPRMPDILSCTPPRVKADGNCSSVTSCGTSDAHTGALTAKPRPSTKTPTRSSIGFRMPAQPSNAKAPAHPASHKLASRSIVPALKASASAPAGSVKRKNGSDARLAIREMKRPDGDIKFIMHVAAVSCAATAVPEIRLANQILRKARLRQALGVA